MIHNNTQTHVFFIYEFFYIKNNIILFIHHKQEGEVLVRNENELMLRLKEQ